MLATHMAQPEATPDAVIVTVMAGRNHGSRPRPPSTQVDERHDAVILQSMGRQPAARNVFRCSPRCHSRLGCGQKLVGMLSENNAEYSLRLCPVLYICDL